MKIIIFMAGLVLGELVGVTLMCMLQINKKSEQ
ncbi:MAG: DUF3789 domain-containing protein [Bacilli bacterium]|nr:DUF3789 domain-containing protein [Bacilli bacterium]